MNRARWIGGRQWVATLCILVGCGASRSLGGFGEGADDGGVDGGLVQGAPDGQSFGSSGGAVTSGPVTDFPGPIVDGSPPPDAAGSFGAPTQGATTGGPCLLEPESDVLYPQNWLRPRFRWSAAGGEDVFELRLHVANQTNDLVVYTTNESWTMPRAAWDALRTHSAGQAMTITLRGGVVAGSGIQSVAIGSQTPMGIAPVQASGAIVYWTTNDSVTGGSVLKGFSPGDETVGPVLTPAQFSQGQQTQSECIGCHASTPDGEFAAFTYTLAGAANAQWKGGIARIDQDAGTVGAAPSFMNAAGSMAIAAWNVGGLAFSPAHWAPGDRTAVFSYDNSGSATNIQLAWVNLDATTLAATSGTIARSGDAQLAGAPSWSHDGKTIAYVSTNRVCTGRLGNCRGDPGTPGGMTGVPGYDQPSDPGSRADVYTVPYGGGMGGQTTPLQGASDPSYQEYYPTYSPDDQLIAFNRIANDLNLYHQPAAEIFVVPASGGNAARLAANDPPQCTGQKSPGLNNVWPKWGPAALSVGGQTYYFLIFSSQRYDTVTDQLYMTSLVRKSDGSIETHGAIYLWNQPATENNHTPAWDKFKVPALPTVQ